ncbi:hypothetical protein DA717_08560, partial [Piscirickettsiaceae bacterium NZ-RLO2]
MPKIIWESEGQRTLEWAIAKEILANATDGMKVQRTQQIQQTNQKIPIDYTDPNSPDGPKIHLSHSFIKVGDKILVLAGRGLYLGIGGYATVKLAENETGQIYTLKIQDKRYDPNEDIVADLYGVSYGRTERDGGRNLNKRKHYSCYKYLGISLKKYLSENQLSVDEQLTLALKLIEAVEFYHHKTGKAHLDLKPDNICIDNTSTICLIDYANSADLAGVTTAGPITPGYVPNREIGHPNESADLIALKRCLYYPDKLCLSAGSLAGGGRLNSDVWIISDEVIAQNLLLQWVVDTRYGELQIQGINAFKQMIAFIKENWELLENNIQLQKAIISLDNARINFTASWERLKGDLELQESIITLDKTAVDLAASWTELKDSPRPSHYIAEKLNIHLDSAQGTTNDFKKASVKDGAKPKRPAYDFNSIEHTITILVHDIANNIKINQTKYSILSFEQDKFLIQFSQMLN